MQFPFRKAFVMLDGEGDVPRSIAYGDLALRVSMLAARLRGHLPENRTAVLMYQDSLEFIISFLACQYAGIIAVPVPYNRGARQIQRLGHILEDAMAGVILCENTALHVLQNKMYATAESRKCRIIPTDERRPSSDETDNLTEPVCNKTAFLQYTSGTTEKPKGVVITHENLLHNQQLLKTTFGCDANSVIFSWLPFHHDMGLIGNILHSIYVGCCCILMSPFSFMKNPATWLRAISDHRVTHSGGPNFAYDLCVEKIPPEASTSLDLSCWKVAYNGSEPVRAETMERFAARFAECGFRKVAFLPCYGLAEATLLVAGRRAGEEMVTVSAAGRGETDPAMLVSSGKIAHGMEVKIIRPDDRHECGEFTEGEICIAGKSVTGGYMNRDNRQFFHQIDGKPFLRTGDLGFLYKGELFVHGRLKEMLIIRGRNFFPQDIERVITQCDQAIQSNGAAVFAAGKNEEDFVVAAEIKRMHVKSIDSARLVALIEKEVIATFGIRPFDIILLSPLGIPRTTSGKIQRIKCTEHYREGLFPIIGRKSHSPGEDGTPAAASPLLLAEVRREGNFAAIKDYLTRIIMLRHGLPDGQLFRDDAELSEIGIDSIRAMELINTVNRDLDINLNASKIFQDNTLSGLITTVENMLWLKTKPVSGNQITI